MASIRLKHRASFFATTQKGISYTRIIYGRRTDDLQAQINEIKKTEKVENIRFFKFTPNGDPYWGCMREIKVK
jgi:hypothetical protein